MLVKVFAAALVGIDAIVITIEVNCSRGCLFHLVGLPDSAVKESRERIKSALSVNGYKLPGKDIVINMAPADIRKEGTAYDLPMAIGIIAADEVIKSDRLSRFMVMGELGLDGSILPVKGALPIAIQARKEGFEGLIVPRHNVREAAVVDTLKVYGADNLKQVIDFFNGDDSALQQTVVNTREEFYQRQAETDLDFADVKGQESVKRALEVAAAGGHNIIMVGPPGSGKSMMAKRLPSILPPLSLAESLETTKIHSVAGKLSGGTSLIAVRPFRSPHHTISQVAMVGGGTYPTPGEISLAHNGVLFLDELPEFNRTVLEVSRQLASRLPSIGVDILFVDAEDWGDSGGGNDDTWALGTQYWVANPHRPGYRPMYGILLDMVGASGATFAREYFSMYYAQGIVDEVWRVAAEAGYDDYFIDGSGGAVTDDHVFVNRAGIPCIDIIDQKSDNGTGFFEQWHTTADTPDMIDTATLKAVGQTVLNVIYNFK